MRKFQVALISVACALMGYTVSPDALGSDTNHYANGVQAEYARNYSTAIEEYSLAAGKGLSDAKLALGKIYGEIYGDSEASIQWYLEAANQGNRFAQYEVGKFYRDGNASIAPDILKAKSWFAKAASQRGSGQASYALYELAETDEVALRWLEQAASAGHIEAMEILSNAYRNGSLDLSIDPVISEQWRQSARQSRE